MPHHSRRPLHHTSFIDLNSTTVSDMSARDPGMTRAQPAPFYKGEEDDNDCNEVVDTIAFGPNYNSTTLRQHLHSVMAGYR